jgi:hypothetical protein
LFTLILTYSANGQTKGSIQITTEQTSDFDPSNSINTPEINFVDGVPIFPWAKPVVILKGSDFEMGYQYAMQLSHIFGDWIFSIIKSEFTSEQEKAIKGYEYYIKKHAPEMIDYIKGMACGAKDVGIDISYNQVLAQFCLGTTYNGGYQTPSVDQDKFPEVRNNNHKCGSFAAWGNSTKDGEVITSSSSDGSDHFNVIIICFPDSGNAFIHSPYYAVGPWVSAGGHSGMNDKGVVYVHHGVTESAQSMGKKPRYGIQSDIAIRHTLRYSNTADEAVKMTLAYETTGDIMGGGYYGTGGFWIDETNNALIIERSDSPAIIRKPGDNGEKDFMYATNTLLSKDVGKENQEYIEHGGWYKKGTNSLNNESVSRNLFAYNILNEYHGQIDLEFVKMVWRYQGNSLPTFGSPDTWEKNIRNHIQSNSDNKYWRTIGHIGNAYVTITIPKEKLFFVSTTYPTWQPNVVSPWDMHMNRWLAYPTRAFYRLFLGTNPSDVMKAAKYQAEIDLYLAESELRKLNYHDPAYSNLDEILNQAIIEWTKGDFWRGYDDTGSTLTIKANQEESIYYWAKATRAYTRCQLLARKVYYALNPPAKKPSDLGLEQWDYVPGE